MNKNFSKNIALLTIMTMLMVSFQVGATTRSIGYSYYAAGPKQGLLESIDGPRTDVTDITIMDYDNQANLTQITNALGHTRQIINYDASGRILESISSNGLHTTFSYDTRGRLIQTASFTEEESAVNARTTSYTYTPAGDIESITAASGEILTYTYDNARRLMQVSDGQGNAVVYERDLIGHILSQTVLASDQTIVRQQRAVYNQLGQLFQTLGAAEQSSEYGYDANGNTQQFTNAEGNSTISIYGPFNRLLGSIDAQGGETQYGYDHAGNLIGVVDPKQHMTTYTYDGLGNLTSLDSPDTGVTNYTLHDGAGNLLQATDANGITRIYSYDALNRLTHIHYPADSSQDIRYYYDGSNYAGLQMPEGQAPLGQRTGLTDASGSIAWFYNRHGDLLETQQTLNNGHSYITSYSYQPNTGLLASITYPSGYYIQYDYRTDGKVSRIDASYQGQTRTLLSNIQYQPFGTLKSYQYGNGLNHMRSFDLDGRRVSQSVWGDTEIQNLKWNYDLLSNIQSLENLLDTTLNQSFEYDILERLSIAQTDTSLYGLLGFQYDANGNRSQQDDNSLITTYTMDSASNRLNHSNGAQSQNFQYDLRGNLIQRSKNGDNLEYFYNLSNRLSQINKNQDLLVTYQYNGLGQRTEKTLADGSSTYYLYTNDGQLMAEVNAIGEIIQEYLYFNAEPLALFKLLSEQPSLDIIHDNTASNVTYVGNWNAATTAAGYTGEDYQEHNPLWSSTISTIIDNQSPQFSTTGEWQTSASVSGYEGIDYVYAASNGTFPGSLVADNNNASSTGSWPISSSTLGYEGSNYQYHSPGSGANTFTWQIASNTGLYQVYARWIAKPNRATDAPYTIHHAHGSTEVRVNQQQNGAQWVLLGSYELNNQSSVVLSDQADGYVIADAIQVVEPDAQPSTATWTLNASGKHQVYAKWTSHHKRASNATYTISHAQGSTDIQVDQSENGQQWYLLGSFLLDENSQVALTDRANGDVVADAIAIQPAATAIWSQLVDTQAAYELYARWPADSTHTTQASYQIKHKNGTSEVTHNQQLDSSQWVLLGEYILDNDSSVHLSSDAEGSLVADALRIVRNAVTSGENALYYYHNDHLGTAQLLTDQNQQIVWQGNYLPFGEVMMPIALVENNLRFPGQYFDVESGLYYNYFRYYDPSLGRYITSDPIGLAGGMNTYAYVGGNPLNYFDTFGLRIDIDGGFADFKEAVEKLIERLRSKPYGREIYDKLNDSEDFTIPIVPMDDGEGSYCSLDLETGEVEIGLDLSTGLPGLGHELGHATDHFFNGRPIEENTPSTGPPGTTPPMEEFPLEVENNIILEHGLPGFRPSYY